VGRAELQAELDMTRMLFDRMLVLVKKGMSAQDMLDAGVMKDLSRTFRDPYRFAYDAHKGYWAHHNALGKGSTLMDTVMKRAIFAAFFWPRRRPARLPLADDTLAGLIQAGNRDAALKKIAAGADVNAAQGDGTTPLHWAVYKIDADLARALLERGAKPDVINNYGSSPLAEAVKGWQCSPGRNAARCRQQREVPNQEGPDRP
jgi:hypothetical protein